MPNLPQTRYFQNLDDMSLAAARFVAEEAERSAAERGAFTLALSGGSTPRRLYERLAQPPFVGAFPWPQTHLFWGDERFVPPNHADNNAAMASHALIRGAPIPPQNVHPIRTDAATPEIAAAEYEAVLREHLRLFDPRSAAAGVPVFDVILLGIGDDGHTASLFLGSPALTERTRWAAAAPMPQIAPFAPRITLTLPVINAAKAVFFLISGAKKRAMLREILDHADAAQARYPAARVQPNGRCVWLVAEEGRF